jgi:lipopolysaccharide transport system ATP-binding protein
MSTVIQIENLSKKYIIGHQKQEKYTTLRDAIMHKIRGLGQRLRHPLSPNKEETNLEEFWALKDINLEIKQGDRVGIIGRNGAGKSTLLKVLSRITEPTTGRISINGRVASLLEVGTGFHPELTGRENIFLNGAILGMSRADIKKNFDEIVAFAEVEKFLDTPVKRYSSGMYVRLAFAVAAHLEPDILIVDEVLAVGDVQFQIKCLGKMEDVSREGRTILFVSHNMGAIRSLCSGAVLLQDGYVTANGKVNDIVEKYLSFGQSFGQGEVSWDESSAPQCDEVSLQSIRLLDSKGNVQSIFDALNSIDVEIKYKIRKFTRGMRIIMSLVTSDGIIAFASTDHNIRGANELHLGEYISNCQIPGGLLNSGHYLVNVHIGIPGVKVLIQGRKYLSMMVNDAGTHGSIFSEKWPGVVAPSLIWSFETRGYSC